MKRKMEVVEYTRFEKLPPDVFLEVLSYLAPKDILTIGQTSKRNKAISSTASLWKQKAIAFIPEFELLETLLRFVMDIKDTREGDWKTFFGYHSLNGHAFTKANLMLTSIWKRSVLPPTSPEYLRFYLNITVDGTPQSPVQSLPLIPDNTTLDDDCETLHMLFKSSSKSLADCVYFFFGEGRKYSQVEFVMINRRAPEHKTVILGQHPYRTNAKYNGGYHFGNDRGFRIKITTLKSKTQLAGLARFLSVDVSAFASLRQVRCGHADRFWTSEDVNSALQRESNTTRPVSVGEVVEVAFDFPVEKLYQYAFCTVEKEETESH
eukprot:TRINITY_DN2315_c0_g1_i5.p1 TRINITY_DN2315_c0_g1~~TRINITY_DN2315_c0_g1_i5.p1  ORF type:complete len:321 (+),score=33.50 TRINITY_DN2315_c0_g1_i5:128-1090(+)